MEKIFDFHVHAYPDKIAAKVMKLLYTDELKDLCSDGTIRDTRRWMKEWNVSGFVLLNLATTPEQTRPANEFLYANSGNGAFPFGTLHPETPDLKGEIQRISEFRFKGIKFHPFHQDFIINDRKKMYPIYEACLNQGLILMFHCGPDPVFPGRTEADFRKAADLIRDFPGGKIVLGHLGSIHYEPEIYDYIIGKDVYLDTSFSILTQPTAEYRKLLLSHDPDKLLYGTDQPWTNGGTCQEKFRALNLPENLQKKIFYDNAARLLDLEEL